MKWLPLAAAFVVSSLLLYGCGRSGATLAVAGQAPILRNPQITPEDLRFDFGGGTVSLKVTVESAKPLRAVMAELTQLDTAGATPRIFSLIPTGGDEFQASIQVPSNIAPTGVPARYRLSVYAEDADRAVSERIEYEIRVAAPDVGGLPGNP